MRKPPKHVAMPTNRVVYIGYIILLLPTIFWFFHFLNFLGVGIFLQWILSLPEIVSLIIVVVCPIGSFIFGSLAYLAHPQEKRKLVYQALIVISIFYILTVIVHMMDGTIS